MTLCLSATANLLMIILIQFIGNRAKPVVNVKNNKHSFKIIQKDALPVAAIICLMSIPYFATQADIVSYVAERHLHIAIGSYFLIYAIVLFIIRISLKSLFFGGLIADYLPLSWFYPIMLVLIPFIIILYLINEEKLNEAVKKH